MKNIICFDLDGTIANLYGVENWLSYLRNEDPYPYEVAEPLVDMNELNQICALLQKAGWEIQVITALSKGASKEYKEAIRTAKRAWLKKWGFIYDHFHGVDYTTPKCEVIRRDMRKAGTKASAILVDDEKRHTDRWNWGTTIDPTVGNLLDSLWELVPDELKGDD